MSDLKRKVKTVARRSKLNSMMAIEKATKTILDLEHELVETKFRVVMVKHKWRKQRQTFVRNDEDYRLLEEVISPKSATALLESLDVIAHEFEKKMNNRWDGKRFVGEQGLCTVKDSSLYLNPLALALQVKVENEFTHHIEL